VTVSKLLRMGLHTSTDGRQSFAQSLPTWPAALLVSARLRADQLPESELLACERDSVPNAELVAALRDWAAQMQRQQQRAGGGASRDSIGSGSEFKGAGPRFVPLSSRMADGRCVDPDHDNGGGLDPLNMLRLLDSLPGSRGDGSAERCQQRRSLASPSSADNSVGPVPSASAVHLARRQRATRDRLHAGLERDFAARVPAPGPGREDADAAGAGASAGAGGDRHGNGLPYLAQVLLRSRQRWPGPEFEHGLSDSGDELAALLASLDPPQDFQLGLPANQRLRAEPTRLRARSV
jgi:hypothetical protein